MSLLTNELISKILLYNIHPVAKLIKHIFKRYKRYRNNSDNSDDSYFGKYFFIENTFRGCWRCHKFLSTSYLYRFNGHSFCNICCDKEKIKRGGWCDDSGYPVRPVKISGSRF